MANHSHYAAKQLVLDESMNSLHSVWIMNDVESCHQTIGIVSGYSITFHEEEWFKILLNVQTLTSPVRRCHCFSLEPNSSALLLGSSKSLTRSFSSPCVMRCCSGEEDVTKSGSCDIDGSGPEMSSSSSYSSDSSENDSGASGTGSPSPWRTGRIADGMIGYCTVSFLFFDKHFPTGGILQK